MGVLNELPDDMQGTAMTLAAGHLFHNKPTRSHLTTVNTTHVEFFHHVTMQLECILTTRHANDNFVSANSGTIKPYPMQGVDTSGEVSMRNFMT